MADPQFFTAPDPLSVAEIIALTGARLVGEAGSDRVIAGVATLDRAGPSEITFIDSPRYVAELETTRAGAVFCAPRYSARVPSGVVALESPEPQRCFTLLSRRFYPGALFPIPVGRGGHSPAAHIDADAFIEDDVVIEAGAVIGPDAEIGRGSLIGANAVIGRSVRIGRGTAIGAGSTLMHALVGDRVIIHPGVRIGQDGFGFMGGAGGHMKVPQIGRVIIQDHVEIGANSTIDRGGLRDTVIGEGTKIDNQVQIGHNVVIGRHCVIVSQVGISGSATLGDFVVIGGQSGVNGHVTIGHGAQIAAVSTVHGDVPAGARWGGVPARPIKEWFRAQTWLYKMSARDAGREKTSSDKE